MKKDLLVTLADNNYIEQAKQLFSSVYWNAGWHGDYMLLAYDIPEKDLQWFRDKGILVRECEPILEESNNNIGHAPFTTLSKFYLFTPEFKKWKNVVFLDGDIVVRGSLESLAEIKGFAAVRILNIRRIRLRRTRLDGQFQEKNKRNEDLHDELTGKYDLSRPAFNSGVMAFSTDIISSDDFQKIKDMFFHFKDIIQISEETVLNLYFYDRWQELSQVYNICPGYETYLSKCHPADLKGIVCHTYSNFPGGKAWLPGSPLSHEWHSNLNNADLIDCSRPQPPAKRLSRVEENRDDFYLKSLYMRHFYRYYRYKMLYYFRNRYWYMARDYLKKNYPGIYKLQRKLRNKT